MENLNHFERFDYKNGKDDNILIKIFEYSGNLLALTRVCHKFEKTIEASPILMSRITRKWMQNEQLCPGVIIDSERNYVNLKMLAPQLYSMEMFCVLQPFAATLQTLAVYCVMDDRIRRSSGRGIPMDFIEYYQKLEFLPFGLVTYTMPRSWIQQLQFPKLKELRLRNIHYNFFIYVTGFQLKVLAVERIHKELLPLYEFLTTQRSLEVLHMDEIASLNVFEKDSSLLCFQLKELTVKFQTVSHLTFGRFIQFLVHQTASLLMLDVLLSYMENETTLLPFLLYGLNPATVLHLNLVHFRFDPAILPYESKIVCKISLVDEDDEHFFNQYLRPITFFSPERRGEVKLYNNEAPTTSNYFRQSLNMREKKLLKCLPRCQELVVWFYFFSPELFKNVVLANPAFINAHVPGKFTLTRMNGNNKSQFRMDLKFHLKEMTSLVRKFPFLEKIIFTNK